MADLGAVGFEYADKVRVQPLVTYPPVMPAYHIGMLPIRGNKAVSGTVTGDDGLPAMRRVRLLRRDSGWVLDVTVSGSDGSFSFGGVQSVPVDVVFQDDDAGTQYHDIIVARVTPG